MSWYTYYSLSLFQRRDPDASWEEVYNPDITDDIKQVLRQEGIIGYVFDENLDSHDKVKWWNHSLMESLSKQFPDILFRLHGNATHNDPEDLWYEYWLNGRVQKCPAIITFDDFDESKLRTLKQIGDGDFV